MIDTDRDKSGIGYRARVARTWEEHNTLGALRAARLSSINAAWFLHYPLLVIRERHAIASARAAGYACVRGLMSKHR